MPPANRPSPCPCIGRPRGFRSVFILRAVLATKRRCFAWPRNWKKRGRGARAGRRPRSQAILKLDHLTIVVSDWRKSRDWYINTLDLELDFEIPEDCTAGLKDDAGFTLILSQTDGGKLPASCALTIQVEDVEARRRKVVETVIRKPQKNAPAEKR